MAFPRRHKYNARRVEIDGFTFPSQLEADVFLLLKKWEDCKQIQYLRHHVSVPLTEAKIKLVADFEAYALRLHTAPGILEGKIWVEAKGKELATWRIKKKLWKFYGPGPLLIYKRAGRRGLVLDEVVMPKSLKEK